MKRASKVRSLLDVNVLVAYFDSDHAFHDRAFEWFQTDGRFGWASCPLTENGVLRVLSNLGYSSVKTYPLTLLVEKFNETIQLTDHEFWSDDISLLDSSMFDTRLILGPRQLTDLYLLALSSKKGGNLVTFDERVSLSAVLNARDENLRVI